MTHNRDTEYMERCGCGRIVVTVRQAHGHAQWCDKMPADSQLLAETNYV
jgi:hypothetical protein